MTPLMYLILGIIAQSSIQPANEVGNFGSYSSIWAIVDRTRCFAGIDFPTLETAIRALLRAGLIESAGPSHYRLARIPVAPACYPFDAA